MKPTHQSEIAARLVLTRQALGLTQSELCRLTGITTQAWNNCETNRGRIGVNSALRICEVFGLSLDWIYRGLMAQLPHELTAKITELQRMAAAAAAPQLCDDTSKRAAPDIAAGADEAERIVLPW